MKALKISVKLFIFCILILYTEKAHATVKYWIGSSGGSFSNNANWSTSSGGANNTTAPGASDIATFDSGDTNNCAVDTTVSVAGIDIKSTYSGTISQGAGVNLTVGSNNFSIAGGTYDTGSASTTFNGTFSLSGGTFIASSATTTFKNNFTITAGTFTHNSGIVAFDPILNGGFTISANNATFYNVTFLVGGTLSNSQTMLINQSFTVANDLLATNNSSSFVLSITSQSSLNPTITVQGNINLPNSTTAGLSSLKIGSTSSLNNFNINLQGNFNVSESSVAYYASTTFTGTGTQTVTKTTGDIFSNSLWGSTKSSGTVSISSYNYSSQTNDKITWTCGTITVTGASTFSQFSLTGGTFDLTSASTTFNGDFSISGGTFTASSATTTIRNTFTITGGTFSHNNGGIAFDPVQNGGFTISPNNATLYNVAFLVGGILSNSQTMLINQSFTVANNLIFTNNSSSFVLSVTSQSSINPTVTVQGDLIIPNSTTNGALTMKIGSATAGSNFNINLLGNLNMTEPSMGYYASTTFSGSGTQTISKTAGDILSTSIWGSTKTAGSLTITSYNYNSSSNDKLTWAFGSITTSGNPMFSQFSLTGGSFSLSNASTTFNNDFSISGGTFTASSATTTYKYTFTSTGGTFTHNSGNVVFDPAINGDFTVAANSITFNNVSFQCTTLSTSQNITLSQPFTVAGNLSAYNNSSSFTLRILSSGSANPTITIQGNLDFPNGTTAGASTMQFGSGTASANFTVSLQGSLGLNESSLSLNTPITFASTSNQSIVNNSGTIGSLSVWTVNKSAGTVTLQNNVTHPSTLTLTSGMFDINGKNLSVTTSFTLNDGATLILQGGETITTPTINSGSTTVIYNGTGTYSSLIVGNSYKNLKFNGTGSWTHSSTLTVTGDLTILNGTLLSTGNAINLTGNWINNSRYTHGNNTVTLNGTDQSIIGTASTTFYNLIKSVSSAATLTIGSTATTTVSNNTTLKGISGNVLSLRSDSTGTGARFNISNSGTRDIKYINVKDSNNVNSTAIVCDTECVNAGNNTNWTFITGLVVLTENASSTSLTNSTFNGSITAIGGEDATDYGFAYGTSPLLTSVISTTTQGSFTGIGNFTKSVADLTCGTTYYFRAYATNSAGTAFGSIKSTITNTCPVTNSGSSNNSSGGTGYENLLGNLSQNNTGTTSIISNVKLKLNNKKVDEHEQTKTVRDNNLTLDSSIKKNESIVSKLSSAIKENSFGNLNEKIEEIRILSKTTTSKVISVTGIVTGSVLLYLNTLASPLYNSSEFGLVTYRLTFLLLSALGVRKRPKPWGTVYDSITKQPIDPAYVTLLDINGNQIAEAITDQDGRFGFLVAPGEYYIKAEKTHYHFPSKVIGEKRYDDLYSDIYLGEKITIKTFGEVLTKNIPMDQEEFDWNEFEKRVQGVTTYYSKWDLIFQKISKTLFAIGFMASILTLLLVPEPYNYIIFGVYLLILLLRYISIKPKTYGIVKDLNGKPLSFGNIKIYRNGSNDVFINRTLDQFGRYYILVPEGKYRVEIEKRSKGGQFTKVYGSTEFEPKNGIINYNHEIKEI